MKKTMSISLAVLAGIIGSPLFAAEKYEQLNSKAERPLVLKAYPWLKKLDAQAKSKKFWAPAYASEKEEAYPGRIVAYAGKWSRHNYGGHGGGPCGYRYSSSNIKAAGTEKKDYLGAFKLELNQHDFDGDGSTADDFVAALPFSMDVPMGIADWPVGAVFPERLSSTFYGGETFLLSNNDPSSAKNWVGEMGINCDHSPPFSDDRAEDHPLNGYKHKKILHSKLKHYMSFIWKKEDFLCNGDAFRTSFDDSSRIAMLCTRGYWYGFNDVRFIVKNNGKFYIDEKRDDVPVYDFKTAAKKNLPTGYRPVCRPTKVKWAEYHPKDTRIDFTDEGAEFAFRTFDNVEAVGWYIAKTDDSNAQTHAKWYGFECDAVIHTPRSGSSTIDMKEIQAKGVPPFFMATYELPYSLWKKMHRYGDSPHYVLEPRYVYAKSGSMGSMAFGEKEHGQDEPVTDLAFYDVLAACNTLSEMERKTPAYYVDAACTEVFRNLHLATLTMKDANWKMRNKRNEVRYIQPVPTIYVKWDANGHRLPTVDEWKAAAGKMPKERPTLDGTVAVNETSVNKNGLFGMSGNVWEYCWTFGDAYDPAVDPAVTVIGGGLGGSQSPQENAPSSYGFKPYDGGGNIGIRLVSRDAGLPPPPGANEAFEVGANMKSTTPVWSFKQNTVVGKTAEAVAVAEPILETVSLPTGTFTRHDKKTIQVAGFDMGKTSVTYSQWKRVKQWAEANGYRFTKSGDMGSMFFFDYRHSPQEPVTHIPWYDAVAWCNALSEMEGRTPCFYADEACSKVYKQSAATVARKLNPAEYIKPRNAKKHPLLQYGDDPNPFLFVRYDVDGYRLPSAAEFGYAVRGGKETIYSWGDDPTQAGAYMWNAQNSEGKTHPVGQKKPNGFGLYDMQGNIYEMTLSRLGGKNKTLARPYSRDLDNPMNSVFDKWGTDGTIDGAPNASGCISGPSFVHGGFNINGGHGLGVQSSSSSFNLSQFFHDWGFRVVRCEAGTHPADGLRPLAEREIIRYLKIDKALFNDLSE